MEKQPARLQQVVYTREGHGAYLEEMRLNDELCDVTIKINEREFRAHKVILAAGIKHFHTMFLSNFLESNQNFIEMTTVKETNMEALITFAYTSKITITDDNVLSLLEDVDYLHVDDVKEACINFLMQNLTFDKALQTYHFAESIDRIALKEAAIQLILADFKQFSQSKEFLDLKFTVLKDILSEWKSDESQCYFEGIVNWLVYDVVERGKHVTDLLSTISISDLTADYLMAYLYENISQEHDAIIRSIVAFYRTRVKQKSLTAINTTNSKQLRLMAVNRSMLSHIQYYNFDKNEWTLCYTNIDHKQYAESIILKNKLYIVGGRTDDRCVAYVNAFDPRTGICSSITSMSTPRRDCAVCSTTKKYLYICGGRGDDGSEMNLVERYDVVANTWEILSPLTVARYNASATFFQGNIYVTGGRCKEKILNSVERYCPASNRWIIVNSLLEPREHHAVAILNDKLYVCGGRNKSSVEVYEPRGKTWQLLPNMQKRRHMFLTIVFEGKLLAVGGDNTQSGPTLEICDPDRQEWSLVYSPSFHIKYLIGGLIQA